MASDEPRKHTLLISARLETAEESLARYLVPGEVIRGVPFSLFIGIKNTGQAEFPGSKDIRMRIEVERLQMEIHEDREIPRLPMQETTESEFKDISLISEGSGWISVSLTASDGMETRYQQFPDAPPDREWRAPIRTPVNKVVALHLAWFVYRGEGEVTFDPPQVKTWEDTRTGANSPWAPLWRAPPVPEDGRWEVRVTFDRPGTYVLRARADDGALYHDGGVTVVVAPVLTPH